MAHEAPIPKVSLPKSADPAYRWTGPIAVSTAVLAALASIASLLSGYHTDEAMIEQVRAADKWSEFQAKSIKAAVLESKMELLPALGKEPATADTQRAARYDAERSDLSKAAQSLEHSADDHRRRRKVISVSVSSFQVAIGLCAIGLLTKRTWFWVIALAAGAAGIVVLAYGALSLAGA